MASPVATTVIGGKVPIRSRNERASRIHHMWRDFGSQREEWAREAANDEDFFLGNQWTRGQIEQLNNKGMAPIVVNKIMPLILQEVAIFTARSPGFKVIPREDGDVEIAHLWGDVLSYIWQRSNGDSELQQTVRDYFAMGAGYMHAYIDPIADDGRGEVMIESLPVWDVYWDPNSRKIDGSDARAVVISRIIDEDSLIFMYPTKKDFIRKAASEGAGISEYGRPQVNPALSKSGQPLDSYDFYPSNRMSGRKVRVNQCYEKILVPMVRVNYLSTGRTAILPEDAWNPELEENPAIIVERFWRKRIRMTQTIGSTDLLFEAILPTEHYPVTPFWLHHTRTPYPKGDTNIAKGQQLEVNKRRSINIHNAMLAGNFKIVHQEGAIANEREYEEKGTLPGFRLRYKKGFEEPKPWYPQSLPNAWYTLEQQSAADMEYSLSVFSHMMGSNADAPETYRGLLALEEAGQKKIQHKARHANHALRILGGATLDLAQALYTQPKLLRITGENNEDYREVWINQKQIDPYTGMVKTVNSLGVGQYDILVIDGTSMPTNRMAMLNLYLEMFQMGVIDAEEVLKKTDINNKKAVLERIGEIQKLQGMVNSYVEENKQLAGLNQTLRRKSQQDEIHLISQQSTETIRDQVRQTTMEQKLGRARVGDAIKNFQQRLLLAEKKVQLDGREVVGRLQLDRERDKALREVRNAQPRATAK